MAGAYRTVAGLGLPLLLKTGEGFLKMAEEVDLNYIAGLLKRVLDDTGDMIDRMGIFEARMSGLEGRMSGLEGRMGALEYRISALAKELHSVHSRHDRLMNRVQKLEET